MKVSVWRSNCCAAAQSWKWRSQRCCWSERSKQHARSRAGTSPARTLHDAPHALRCRVRAGLVPTLALACPTDLCRAEATVTGLNERVDAVGEQAERDQEKQYLTKRELLEFPDSSIQTFRLFGIKLHSGNDQEEADDSEDDTERGIS